MSRESIFNLATVSPASTSLSRSEEPCPPLSRIIVPLNSSSVKIITSTLPPASVKHPYHVVIQCNQPGSGCAFPLQVSSLPPGLSNNNSELGGIPTTAGSFTFTVTVTASG